MVTYPVRVPRKDYRGSNRTQIRKVADRNEIAAELEQYINAKIKAEIEKGDYHTHMVFKYANMAHDIRYDEKTIRDICYAVDGGSNGFTVAMPEKETDASTF